ncbi:hypothetical protein B0I35DRAFT_515389 [Stachybotrys elegans]|uniref:Uncharacterized protein n=1 Tax=Stachybotrys elegans TaxID=80388 RepID=A0A8K0WLN3_9HYPO|nr:hypothetical protein B0I35DRAFT_515389 [Stachybotrys elegans]
MASDQNRKRSRADDLSQDHCPDKKIKSRSKLHGPSNFPPDFWDNLSKVCLTRRALRELDRRNSTRPAPGPATPAAYAIIDLAKFARRGGPDLRYLGRCPEPKDAKAQVASSRSSASSRRTKSTKATTLSRSSGKPSAYGPEFETHLTDHGVYPEGYEYPEDRSTPEPGNQAHQDLSVARPSLSPSCFPESKFRDFKQKDARATFENDVMAAVVPIICGDADIPSRQNAPDGRPEYHMTKVRGFDMTDSRETFVQGATAFLNARDLAQRHRDAFIHAANARARQTDAEVPPEADVTVVLVEQSQESASENFVEQSFAQSPVEFSATQEARPGHVAGTRPINVL